MANPFSDTKTLIAFAERAHQLGFATKDLQQAIDHPSVLRRLVDYIKAGAPPIRMLGHSYNAAEILAFGTTMLGKLPEAEDGDVFIWYGGWSLQELRDNPLVRQKDLMMLQDWYNEESWSTEVLSADFYQLRIPVSRSGNKMFDEQEGLITANERAAHPLLIATAWICHKLQTGKDLFKNKWIRSGKRVTDDECNEYAELHCDGRQLHIDGWDDEKHHAVYFATEVM